MSRGVVTEHVYNLIARQVEDHGLVVWYDPERSYTEAVEGLHTPDTTVLRYEDSFINLRREIDQQELLDGEQPPRLVVYVPVAQGQTHYALIELEAAGVVMQPGQQPPARNTRLAIVARNALKGILGEDGVVDVEKQADAGRLTLAELDALADQGPGLSKTVLALIFRTANPQDIALSFLGSEGLDSEIERKDAGTILLELFRQHFGFSPTEDGGLDVVRRSLTRHVLMTDFVVSLGGGVPSRLESVPIATSPACRDSCQSLARAWRTSHDTRRSYVPAARRIEREFALTDLGFDAEQITSVETFPTVERVLLRHAENRLLQTTDGSLLTLAESRLSGYWCDMEPTLQARWALVASAAQVLLEVDRVSNELKDIPSSMKEFIEEYAGTRLPWCLLDTYHRHMESRWHSFEPQVGDDHDSIEKLVIRARQRYSQVGSELAERFVRQTDTTRLPAEGLLRQREIFETHLKPRLARQKIAYVWVDALRFEMGRELARLLREDFEVELDPALGSVPTVTEIGMAALLPGAHESAKVVTTSSGKLALEIGGEILRDRKDRVAFLRKHSGVSVFDAKLDDILPKPSKKVREGIEGADLTLVTSQEIDQLCEQGNITQARRQMDGVLNDLRRGMRALVQLGVQVIVVVSDHGHLFAEELTDDMKIDPPGGHTVSLHRRVWIGHGGSASDAYVRAPLSTFDMEGDFDLAAPWTFACFKSKGGGRAYFHGGLSPQELVVPVLILQPLAKAVGKAPAGILWKLILGSKKLTTRFFSVQVAGENTGLFELEPPKVRVELRAKSEVVSRPVSASYGFDEAAGDVTLKIDEADPRNIAPNTVTLMLVDKVDQDTVGLYLLDATTGAELTRMEKIEVAITI